MFDGDAQQGFGVLVAPLLCDEGEAPTGRTRSARAAIRVGVSKV